MALKSQDKSPHYGHVDAYQTFLRKNQEKKPKKIKKQWSELLF